MVLVPDLVETLIAPEEVKSCERSRGLAELKFINRAGGNVGSRRTDSFVADIDAIYIMRAVRQNVRRTKPTNNPLL